MFTKLRQMYYKHQDEKVYKKYVEPEKKQNRNKIGSNQDKKGIFILIAVFSSFIAVILIAIILKHTLIKKSSDTGEETKAVNTTYAVETESETTTFLEETITEESTVEETVTEETISETVTTVKKKKKKYKVKTTEAVTTRKYNISVPNKPEIPVVTTKPTETEKKVNNKFPTQKEDNSILSKNNMNLIRNSIISAADGTYNDNLQNLAIYMANKGLKNAQSAVSEILDNSTLKVTSKTATVTIYSTDSEEVLQAAEELAEMLCGTYNTYGVGIKASYRSGKYNIYVVVAALR